MRKHFMPAACVAILAAMAASPASAQDDEIMVAKSLQRLAITMGNDCAQAHPGLEAEIERVRTAWLARNEKVFTQVDARWKKLSAERQAAVLERVEARAASFRAQFAQAEASGQGEQVCTKTFAAFDTAPLLDPPPAR